MRNNNQQTKTNSMKYQCTKKDDLPYDYFDRIFEDQYLSLDRFSIQFEILQCAVNSCRVAIAILLSGKAGQDIQVLI